VVGTSPREERKPNMEFKLKGRMIFFATNNVNKFNEVRKVLAWYRIASAMLRAKKVEIQSDKLSDIARTSAVDAFRRCHLPIIVEDAGLFIHALHDFPGPYAAYAYKTISNAGLLKLMANVEDRKATFQSVIAYYDGHSAPMCFEGEAAGKIINEEKRGKGKSGFGFDPIFQPAGSAKTFAEMTIEEKNRFSHRAKAVCRFAEWYKKLT
jgi:XTP/dITP diphosphohydrolase